MTLVASEGAIAEAVKNDTAGRGIYQRTLLASIKDNPLPKSPTPSKSADVLFIIGSIAIEVLRSPEIIAMAEGGYSSVSTPLF